MLCRDKCNNRQSSACLEPFHPQFRLVQSSTIIAMIIDLSPAEYRATFVAYLVELTGDVILVFVSIAVLRSVLRCSVIHMNLRLLLAFKCVVAMVHGCDRSVFIIGQFFAASFDVAPPQLVSFFTQICAAINMYLCVAYTTERIYATICVKTYEKKRPYYGCLCVLVMLGIATYNSAQDHLMRSASTPSAASYGVVTYLTSCISVLAVCVCLPVVFCIMKYNFNFYRQQLRGNKVGALGERYQNSENIRTTRQLMPVIFLHATIGAVGATSITLALFSPSPRLRFLQRQIMFQAYSILYNLCQVAVLYFHPALRKEVVGFLRRLYCCTKRCRPTSAVGPSSTNARTLCGGQLIEAPAAEADVYFAQLAKSWELRYDESAGNKR